MSEKAYLLLFNDDSLTVVDFSDGVVEPVLVYGESSVSADDFFWNNQEEFWQWLKKKESLRAKDSLNVVFTANKKSVLGKVKCSSKWKMDWTIESLIAVLTELCDYNVNLYFGENGRSKKISIEQNESAETNKLYVKGVSSDSLNLYFQKLKDAPQKVVKEPDNDVELSERSGLDFGFFETQMKKNESNRIKKKIGKNAKIIKIAQK